MRFWNKHRRHEVKFASVHDAVEAGDYASVQRFLSNGVDANAQDGRGATALHIAAARGHLEIAKLLLDGGGDVNFLIEEGGTPLMSACSRLKPRLVELLLCRGAQPNKRGDGGRFPLSCPFQPAVAAVQEQLECINLLIDHGANVDGRTDDGGTPLMEAAWFGNQAAAVELLRLGADPTLRDGRGRTAAMLAFDRGHDELAKLLKGSADQRS